MKKKKSNKRKIAVVALALCLIAILSMGSLAWFSASDEITNTLNFDTNFDIDLYEHNDDGTIHYEGNLTLGRTYNDLTPGKEIVKDPTVINKSAKADQYIRMTVTVTKAFDWAKVVGSGADLSKIFTGFDKDSWKRYDEPVSDPEAKTITYVYYYNGKLAAGSTATLFTGVKIPENLTLDDAKTIQGFEIIVKAEAIQTTDLGSDVTTSYEAFKKVGM